MNLILRPGTPSDADVCGEICWRAFTTINEKHHFPPDFPSKEVATNLFQWMLGRPDVYSIVAEMDGKIAGSNFLWEADQIAGIGPITIDPKLQNSGTGRRLMEDVLERSKRKNFPGVRLVQAAFHNRSLSLYTKLGFVVREPLSAIQGTPLKQVFSGASVMTATPGDLEGCNSLCRKIHGHDRRNELAGAIQKKSATVVLRNGRITGYATEIGFFGHAVAESNDDLKALIAAAPAITGPGFLLPSRNSELLRWCLNEGLKIVEPMTLMSMGLYNEPSGAFLPSILY